MDIPDELIDEVDALSPELISLPGVTGVGIGFREEDEEFFDELAVRVLVADASQVPDGIPETIAGVPVCVVEFPVEPLFAPDLTRYDHLPGGAQIQPVPFASGTLGAIVQDANGDLVAFTCHHVSGKPGTPVCQPEPPAIPTAPDRDLSTTLGGTIVCE